MNSPPDLLPKDAKSFIVAAAWEHFLTSYIAEYPLVATKCGVIR
jgi:hypothetical protein